VVGSRWWREKKEEGGRRKDCELEWRKKERERTGEEGFINTTSVA
jgi:hypothetical protein